MKQEGEMTLMGKPSLRPRYALTIMQQLQAAQGDLLSAIEKLSRNCGEDASAELSRVQEKLASAGFMVGNLK